ncbi:FAD-dependent 2-octaprenylphenol hydroxylase [Pasteurellaceae bacterium Macca]|nr:FAD-dependent 2-octaprenylphenol hydroxylase [Pasteurellaceae bacterium Macca]
MRTADLVIIGGGMVGLALVASLARTNCRIILIERHPFSLSQEGLSYRISAINGTSQQFLMDIGAWQHIPTSRLSPYKSMLVWEKDSFARIQFNQDDPEIQSLGLERLGTIIENSQIQSALWQQVTQQENVEVIYSLSQNIGLSDSGAVLTLENGEMIIAKLLVGADGANSWLRQQVKIPLVSRDYQHTALVCNVRTIEPHCRTARQVFSPDSILAFLPLNDPHLCSIVWSLPPEKAEKLVQMEAQAFQQALTIAFDNQLGLCELISERNIYPLTARYARDFAQPRLALIGDAAHTIHPLAGLGVNLGFGDAALLGNELRQRLALGEDIGDYRHLRQFERRRKVEAVKVLAAMEGLKQLFAGNHPLKKLVRGIGLTLTNQNTRVKRLIIEQAMGI